MHAFIARFEMTETQCKMTTKQEEEEEEEGGGGERAQLR
jgi:hypothetical protein